GENWRPGGYLRASNRSRAAAAPKDYGYRARLPRGTVGARPRFSFAPHFGPASWPRPPRPGPATGPPGRLISAGFDPATRDSRRLWPKTLPTPIDAKGLPDF